MKLNPPASSSDLDLAREIAQRLHERRRRGNHAPLADASPRPEPQPADSAPSPAVSHPSRLAPPLPPRVAPPLPPSLAPSLASSLDLDAIGEAPPPPSWDAPVGEADPQEDAFAHLADLGEPPLVADDSSPDDSPLPDVEVEDDGISPEEMIGAGEAETALGDLSEAEAPAASPSPFELDLDEGAAEDVVGASALPSWDDIVERCLGLAQARAAMLVDPAGQVFAAHGDWPAPGPDTIAGKLVATMNRTLRDAPTRSISAPLGGEHLTAWRVPLTEGLVTVAFLGEAPVRTEARPAIDTEIHRGAGA